MKTSPYSVLSKKFREGSPAGISYTRAREIVKEAFKDISDVSKISLHSLRSGGASAAANAGILDRLFERHGRWASENAKDCQGQFALFVVCFSFITI